MEDSEVQPSPSKKLKMDVESATIAPESTPYLGTSVVSTPPHTQVDQSSAKMEIDPKPPVTEAVKETKRETEVGITKFVSPDLPGFSGILKKRYTDFLVNEILPNGQVVHLDNLKAPKRNKSAHPASHSEVKSQPGEVENGNSAKQTVDETLVSGKPDSSDEPAQHLDQAEDIPLDGNDLQAAVTESTQPESIEQHASKQESLPEDAAKASNFNIDGGTANGDAGQPAKEADMAPGSNTAGNGAANWQVYAANETPAFMLSPGDEASLKTFFSNEIVAQALDLFNRVVNSPHRKPHEYGFVTTDQLSDKQMRTKMHQEIRRIFSARLESYTDSDGIVTIAAAQQGSHRAGNSTQNSRGRGQGDRGRGGRGHGGRQQSKSLKEMFAEHGGDFVHFSLYKENKDTMEVVSHLARQLRLKPGSFQFAGTKDRRAVTVQRVSVYRIFAERLAGLNRNLRNAKIGNFEYHHLSLELGDLNGNEFLITLRDCKFPIKQDGSLDECISAATQFVNTAMQELVQHGFLNYYGLQRFGSFATRTDVVGMMLLKGDFKGAVDAILEFTPESLAAANDLQSANLISNDDKARAWALDSFKGTGQSDLALERLPRKFSAESNIIRHLSSSTRGKDYFGALQTIPKNLRIMYAHAYQSVIWNLVASQRWSQHGGKVVEGDLVLVNEHKDKDKHPTVDVETLDADGEIIVEPAADDRTTSYGDRFERARALTKEEAESGSYTIFDVVLPMPGYDIIYPSYLVGFYETTMGSEKYGKLDPHDMHRPWKEYSLSGSYRKLLARPSKDYSVKVVAYTDDTEQLVKTDLDNLTKAERQGDLARDGAKEREKAQVEHGHGNNVVAAPSMGTAPAVQSEERKPANALPSGLKQDDNKDAAMEDDLSVASKAKDAKTDDEGIGGGKVDEEMTDEKEIDKDTANKAEVDVGLAEAGNSEEVKHVKLAVVLKVQLGSSQYATMALRELMKLNDDPTYKPDYGSGR